MDQYEREEQALHEQYACGEITATELNKRLRELWRDAADEQRGAAEEAAAQAYDDVMGRW